MTSKALNLLEQLLEQVKNPKILPQNIKGKINKDLDPMGKKYHNAIPLEDIQNILKKYGLIALQEDHTEWSGFLVGANSHTNMELGYTETKDENKQYKVITNASFNLSWYKMSSGRYEIVVYVG